MLRLPVPIALLLTGLLLTTTALAGDSNLSTVSAGDPATAAAGQIAKASEAEYTRPTAKDQKATAKIPVKAWGDPVNGLRMAIVMQSPPVDNHDRLCYEIVAENVSDRDIRFAASVGNNSFAFCQIELVDNDGKQVPQQQGRVDKSLPSLVRYWLKPGERVLVSPWNTQLVMVQKKGQPMAEPKRNPVGPFFKIMPGKYSVSSAVELGPNMHSLDPATRTKTVLSPAQGEWSGKLKTGTAVVASLLDANERQANAGNAQSDVEPHPAKLRCFLGH